MTSVLVLRELASIWSRPNNLTMMRSNHADQPWPGEYQADYAGDNEIGCNPFEIFDRIRPPWWHHDNILVEQAQDQERVRKEHVTLFFDTVKHMTIAVLANDGDGSLSHYFQGRIEAGTAYSVSPLYIELDGFVRENMREIQCSLPHLPSSSIVLAVGSLVESDAAQRNVLLDERAARQPTSPCDGPLLEQVLEICRLVRLQDDLDVLSIYFMRQVSKSFAAVAKLMAQRRLADLSLSVTPFVDGCAAHGYSRFVRRDGRAVEELVQHYESGRVVDYEQCHEIRFKASALGVYEPRCAMEADFSWHCEEVTLANLHRWWGDIALPDYQGQKLVLYWCLGSADALSLDKNEISLGVLRLPVEMGAPKGRREWHISSLISLVLQVIESGEPTRVDDVAMAYAGRARVCQAKLDYLALVRAMARGAAPQVREYYRSVLEVRPLLPGEEDYLQQLEALAAGGI